MKNETLNLLQEMMKEYSYSGNTAALNRNAARIRSYMESKGLYCETFPVGELNLLYVSNQKTRTPDYMFNAHIDVVPVSFEGQQNPKIENGVLYGRGASDCQGSAACIMELLMDAPEGTSAGAFFTMDEETGGDTTGAMVANGFQAKKAYVIIDASYAAIAYAQKGILSLKLTAYGKGGHSSEPWMFDNPVDKLINGYLRLRNAWKQPTAKDNWHNSMAATVISGGAVTNQIPDSAELTLNIRYVDPAEDKAILEFIRSTTGLEVTLLRQCPPVSMPEDDPELLRMKRCYEAELPGREIKLYRMQGATDARHCSGHGAPVLVLGLDGGGAHSANEFLRLDSIDSLKAVLLRFITEKQ